MNRAIMRIFIIYLSIIPSLSFASWEGPQEVVTGTWGRGPGQFYYHHGDTTDSFPQIFGVDKNGLIVIPDGPNKRIMIYNADGTRPRMDTDAHGYAFLLESIKQKRGGDVLPQSTQRVQRKKMGADIG